MRQFLAPSMPDDKGSLTLTGKDFKYLYQVLRLRKGDTIHVRLPSGQLQSMSVVTISGRYLTLSCCSGNKTLETGVKASEVEAARPSQQAPLWLFQFLPKAQKMDLILRQATELGVTLVIPILGLHCQKDAVHQRSERWQRIIREARQQSGSPVATEVAKPCNLEQAMALWNDAATEDSLGVVLYERSQGTKSFHQAMASPKISLASLVSGCEGGIAPEEIEMLKARGFIPVHLDTNILRAETASIYGLAVLQNLLTERPQWQLSESNF